MLEELHAIVCEAEQDRSLERPEQLRERVLAMDRLEDVLLHEPVSVSPTCKATMDALRHRAQVRHAALADIQRHLCDAVRHAIVHGAGVHALSGWLRRDDLREPWGYDHLDALIGDVLSLDDPSTPIASLENEMVFYQPTPVRHVLDMIHRTRLGGDDVVVDLGSGMGHVPLLVSICTDACACGIERESAYVESARRAAKALHVDRATFIAQDARDADVSRGTVFYLYTPFTGGMLRHMLDRLHDEARQRSFRVVTLGPCTPAVAGEPWLQAASEPNADRITVFRSVA